MAYTKRTWSCGDKITADALNHMEQGIEDAYDKGYECEESRKLILNESVTTEANDDYAVGEFAYVPSSPIDANYVVVTFNGTEYLCQKQGGIDTARYGSSGNDFIEFPFRVVCRASVVELWTPTVGTYSVKIEELEMSATNSACFNAAVEEAMQSAESVELVDTDFLYNPISYYLNAPVLTVPANSFDTIKFTKTTSSNISQYATLRDIVLASGLVLCNYSIKASYVSVGVYNATNSSIAVNSTNTYINVADYETYNQTVCVLKGYACGSTDPK